MNLLRQAAKAVFAIADLILPTPRGPRLLIYHQVGTGTGKQMEVSLDDFLWQMNWLVANREVVSLDAAVRRWEEPGSDRLVVLTFDDGYEDTYTKAFPLLAERGFPFTLYLTTEMIENGKEGALGWGQILAMLDSGLATVGSHTHTHRDLRSVPPQEIRQEMLQADQIIKERSGVVPQHFAYPWGYWSPVAHQVATEEYKTAVLGGSTKRVATDFHRLHRYPIQLSDQKLWFGSRLRGGLMVEEMLRRRLRGYTGP